MSGNISALALKNTIDELQNTCPDILHALIIKNNELLAKTENTNETAANNTLNAFKAITERAAPLGNLTNATIQAAKGKVNISCINDFYMATVLSKDADEKYINALTRTIIPIITKLSTQITPTHQETQTLELEPIEKDAKTEETRKEDAAILKPAEEQASSKEAEKNIAKPLITKLIVENLNGLLSRRSKQEEGTEDVDEDEKDITKPPVIQLIVENLNGLLLRGNIVQIDRSIIEEWNELYGEDAIKEVHIETLNGKTTRCKFKPIKDSKQEGKGIIKLPEKMQITLEATQGDLVMVKPVVE